LDGRLFQTCGPAAAKVLSPKLLHLRLTTSWIKGEGEGGREEGRGGDELKGRRKKRTEGREGEGRLTPTYKSWLRA